MRIALSHVNAYLINGLYRSGAIADIQHNGLDIVLALLPTGEKVAIHLVERDIDIGEIHSVLTRNTTENIYTLFILWCPMLLPDHGMMYRPYDWMRTLLAVYGDRIYGFESEGANTFVFPVHFDTPDAANTRYVHWGENIALSKLYCRSVYIEEQPLHGNWRIADFEPVRQQPGVQTPADPMYAFYEILGVGLQDDWETIRKAYRDLARRYHPDVNMTPEANTQMQRINTAYERLRERFESQD